MVQMIKQDTTLIESPTVKQIRIAFEQTPSKLRAAEWGWRARRKQQVDRSPPAPRVCKIEHEREGIQVRHQARYAAGNPATPEIVFKAKPFTGPPTPPQTPPADQGDRVFPETDNDLEPRPILAYPLAPTLKDIRLGRDGSLSIPQSPSSLHECILRIGNQSIFVAQGGNALQIQSNGKARTITRKNACSWSELDRQQWVMVSDLIDEVKRKTPRIRIYHPSALITITCSSPPDTIIAFTMTSNAPHSKHNRNGNNSVTTVKLVYSPGRDRMVIDTNNKHGSKGESTFRTRRSVPLPPSHLQNLVERQGTSSADAAVGVHIGRDWLRAEVEAVERFWALRDEWLR